MLEMLKKKNQFFKAQLKNLILNENNIYIRTYDENICKNM